MTQSGGHRLVDNVDAFQSGQTPRLSRPLPLDIAELGRDGNDSLLNRTEPILRPVEQLANDEGRDIDGRVTLAIDRPRLAGVTHVPLGVLDHAIRVRHSVTECFRTDDHIGAVNQDDRRSGQFSFLVGKRNRLALRTQIRNTGIGRPQVDSDRVSERRHAILAAGE